MTEKEVVRAFMYASDSSHSLFAIQEKSEDRRTAKLLGGITVTLAMKPRLHTMISLSS